MPQFGPNQRNALDALITGGKLDRPVEAAGEPTAAATAGRAGPIGDRCNALLEVLLARAVPSAQIECTPDKAMATPRQTTKRG